ncbi:MAG TPA: hypothetical protein VM819_17360 [Vicinamibacterales bacterium]|nr:hypothetical protein [Vicinamibacterales bacterium]
MSRAIPVLLTVLLVSGCRSVEVEKAIEVTDVQTGWYDAGLVENGQKNKLVPSISLRLHNITQEQVSSVQLNAIFRRVNEPEAWGEHYVMAINREGLAPGAKTAPIVLRSNLGYTGTQSRMQMLQNREFVDAKVEIYGKSGSRTWVKLAEHQIGRELLTE